MKFIKDPFIESNRKKTLNLLAVFVILVIASSLITISDNPPGIVLAFLSSVALVLAFVHHWQTAKQFFVLAIMSIIVFVIAAVLHNIFEGLGGLVKDYKILFVALNGIGVFFFLAAIFVCPAGVLVGIMGWIYKAIKKVKNVNE